MAGGVTELGQAVQQPWEHCALILGWDQHSHTGQGQPPQLVTELSKTALPIPLHWQDRVIVVRVIAVIC